MLKKTFFSGVITVCAIFVGITQVSADSCQPTSGTPSGTVTYNGQTVTVTSGVFTLNGVTGSIDNGGYVSYNGYVGCLTNIPGVTGYTVSGQAAVALVPVFTGTVTYGNDSVPVNNGKFTFKGKAGTVTSSGSDWVVSYDGQSAKINAIDCLTSYRIDGQSTVTTGKAMCSAGGTDLTSWANAHGGLQKNRSANWQEFSANVSQYQVEDWLVNNPNLTPMQVFESMKANQVTFLTISLAWHRAGSRGALYDFNFANPPVTTRMIYNAGLIDIPKSRSPGNELAGVFSGDNVREAAIYGLLPVGVRQADICRIDGSIGTNESIAFSQNDLNLAQQYRNSGYWGPNDTGNIQWEIQKLGISKARLDYTSTGPNIATANDCKLVNATESIKSTTNSTANTVSGTCSNLYWFDNNIKACGQKQFCGTYMYQGLQTFSTQSQCLSAIGGSSSNDDNEDGVSSCVDIPVKLQYLSRDSGATQYVTILQDFLHENNYLATNPTGFFGAGTVKAVKAFQKAYNISQTGALGPNTRAKLKAVSCDATVSTLLNTAQPIAASVVNTPTAKVLGVNTSCLSLSNNMHRGREGDEVKNLQAFLNVKGFYIEDVTGFYGDSTIAAVKDYQASKNLPVTGMVYDATRAVIKTDGCK